jgi:hypothetical protein
MIIDLMSIEVTPLRTVKLDRKPPLTLPNCRSALG